MRNILVGTANVIFVVLIIHLDINYIYTYMCVQRHILCLHGFHVPEKTNLASKFK